MNHTSDRDDLGVVICNIPRNDPELLDGFALAGVSTVHEAQGRSSYLGPEIRPRQDGISVAGNALTVLCHPGDNLMLHAAVELCRPSDVLVVATTDRSPHGMFGELLATAVAARGVRALVIDSGIRDVAELRAMGFPVWSRFVSSQGTVKETAGWVNLPVSIEGVPINPGDVICADDDGVVVVARGRARDCLEKARGRLERESLKRRRLAEGALSLDVDGIRDKLASLGVRYFADLDAYRSNG